MAIDRTILTQMGFEQLSPDAARASGWISEMWHHPKYGFQVAYNQPPDDREPMLPDGDQDSLEDLLAYLCRCLRSPSFPHS